MNDDSFLTDDEHQVVELLGEAWNVFCRTLDDSFRHVDSDNAEFVSAIHVAQNIVLSRAASRAYPDRYRV